MTGILSRAEAPEFPKHLPFGLGLTRHGGASLARVTRFHTRATPGSGHFPETLLCDAIMAFLKHESFDAQNTQLTRLVAQCIKVLLQGISNIDQRRNAFLAMFLGFELSSPSTPLQLPSKVDGIEQTNTVLIQSRGSSAKEILVLLALRAVGKMLKLVLIMDL